MGTRPPSHFHPLPALAPAHENDWRVWLSTCAPLLSDRMLTSAQIIFAAHNDCRLVADAGKYAGMIKFADLARASDASMHMIRSVLSRYQDEGISATIFRKLNGRHKASIALKEIEERHVPPVVHPSLFISLPQDLHDKLVKLGGEKWIHALLQIV